jgi:hypothetical protein
VAGSVVGDQLGNPVQSEPVLGPLLDPLRFGFGE